VAGGSNAGAIVTSQPWSIADSAAEPEAISYRIERSSNSAPVGIVNFISANADLAALHPAHGTLTPDFAPGITGYTLSVPNAVSSIAFTATPSDGTATMLLNGALPLLSGVASNALPVNHTQRRHRQ
jgi:hypothetical protein